MARRRAVSATVLVVAVLCLLGTVHAHLVPNGRQSGGTSPRVHNVIQNHFHQSKLGSINNNVDTIDPKNSQGGLFPAMKNDVDEFVTHHSSVNKIDNDIKTEGPSNRAPGAAYATMKNHRKSVNTINTKVNRQRHMNSLNSVIESPYAEAAYNTIHTRAHNLRANSLRTEIIHANVDGSTGMSAHGRHDKEDKGAAFVETVASTKPVYVHDTIDNDVDHSQFNNLKSTITTKQPEKGIMFPKADDDLETDLSGVRANKIKSQVDDDVPPNRRKSVPYNQETVKDELSHVHLKTVKVDEEDNQEKGRGEDVEEKGDHVHVDRIVNIISHQQEEVQHADLPSANRRRANRKGKGKHGSALLQLQLHKITKKQTGRTLTTHEVNAADTKVNRIKTDFGPGSKIKSQVDKIIRDGEKPVKGLRNEIDTTYRDSAPETLDNAVTMSKSLNPGNPVATNAIKARVVNAKSMKYMRNIIVSDHHQNGRANSIDADVQVAHIKQIHNEITHNDARAEKAEDLSAYHGKGEEDEEREKDQQRGQAVEKEQDRQEDRKQKRDRRGRSAHGNTGAHHEHSPEEEEE